MTSFQPMYTIYCRFVLAQLRAHVEIATVILSLADANVRASLTDGCQSVGMDDEQQCYHRLSCTTYSQSMPPHVVWQSFSFASLCLFSCLRVSTLLSYSFRRYTTIRDAILTCARKPTWVSLIYRTERTTKKCKNKKKLKSKKRYAQK